MADGQDRVVSELRSIKTVLWILLGVALVIGWRLL
jgi:hypothetical protein